MAKETKVVITKSYDEQEWMIGKVGILKSVDGGPLNNPHIIIKDDEDKEHDIYGHECWWTIYKEDMDLSEEGIKKIHNGSPAIDLLKLLLSRD